MKYLFFFLARYVQCIAIPRGKISEEGHVSGQPKVVQILLLVQQSNRNNTEREKKKKICEHVTEHVKMLHCFQVSKSVPTAMQQEQRCIGIKAEEGRRKKKKFVV